MRHIATAKISLLATLDNELSGKIQTYGRRLLRCMRYDSVDQTALVNLDDLGDMQGKFIPDLTRNATYGAEDPQHQIFYDLCPVASL